MKYAFIQRHKRIWPIRVQCRVLGVSSCSICAKMELNLEVGTISTARQFTLLIPMGSELKSMPTGRVLNGLLWMENWSAPPIESASKHSPSSLPTAGVGALAGTTMGHVHFYVGDLEQAKPF
jgi:hypothetical protein